MTGAPHRRGPPQGPAEPAASPAVSTTRRLAWLLACLAGGAAIGGLGHAFTGSEAWYVAVPLVLALGWWRLAEPDRCATLPLKRRGHTAADAPESESLPATGQTKKARRVV